MKTKELTVSDAVRSVLLRMRWVGNQATMPQLDRPTYMAVNKVLELAGGRWEKRAKAHVFDEDGQDKIAQAIETGSILDAKKTFQFFPTPPELAARMVDLINPEDFEFILEPSAGDGALVAALIEDDHARSLITALELNPEYAAKCYKNTGVAPRVADFMTWTPPFKFNHVIMNPPFTGGQDVDHVTRAFEFLEPGGRLVAITAPSWQFRTNKKFEDFRKLVSTYGEAEEIPAGTFQESGTDIRTVLVTLEK
jgi:hypothetical protein